VTRGLVNDLLSSIAARDPGGEEGLTVDEDDYHGRFDPLWYDRVEPDLPPGLLLNLAAYLFLMLMAAVVVGAHVYWMPDRLWCWVSRRIQSSRAVGGKRF
jgi:hypothetical protein